MSTDYVLITNLAVDASTAKAFSQILVQKTERQLQATQPLLPVTKLQHEERKKTVEK